MSSAEPQLHQRASADIETEAAERLLRGELPIPMLDRWQPLRAGMLNLFLFEDERFPFYGGKLLLRGSNGAGKSRVLAMTLPLLLDGSLKATRVEPDRDSHRQVSWNVLGDDQNSATGYSWLEFGRFLGEPPNHESAEAVDPYLTIGIGIKAVRGGAMKSWFFVTPLRVDQDLFLKTADGVPLTARGLEEAIAGKGQVLTTATEYRRVVDERLFRLGDRYEPLIDLLLQLRQPKLAEKLDVDQMEAGLRAALPPLSQALLDDAADAFGDLDQYRMLLDADRRLLADIKRFVRPYVAHIRCGVLRVVKSLTQANSRFEAAQRRLRQLEETQIEHSLELQRLERRKQQLKTALNEDQAAIEELQRSPEMRNAQRLDELRESAKKAADRWAEVAGQLERATGDLDEAQTQAARVGESVAAASAAAQEASRLAREAAAPESLQNVHREWLSAPLESADETGFAAAQSKLEKEIRRHQEYADQIVIWTREVENARRRWASAKSSVEQAQMQVSSQTQKLDEAVAQLETARETAWQSILSWHESAGDLAAYLPPLPQWHDVWQAWADTLVDREATRDPSEGFLAAAAQQLGRRFADERADVHHLINVNLREIEELQPEQSELQAGKFIVPPFRPGRQRPHRAETAGAPLWKLIEFVPEAPQHERAGWEAALEDSGLLDAWVSPDGALIVDEDHLDAQVMADQRPIQPFDRQLRRVVQPEPGACESASISPTVLDRLLEVIGVGEGAGATWVAADGRWQNGPLHGRWGKDEPQFIGADVRARCRERRLMEIAEQLARLDQEQTAHQQSLGKIGSQESAAHDALQTFPSSRPTTEAAVRVASSSADVDRARQAAAEAVDVEAANRRELEASIERRLADATDLGLAAWVDRADQLQQRLQSYRDKLQTLAARFDASCSVKRSQQQVEQTVARIASQVDQQRALAERLQSESASESRRASELERTLGQDHEAIMQRLEKRREQLKSDADELDKNDEAIIEANRAVSGIATNIGHANVDSEEFDQQRREAADWFGALHDRGLLVLAQPSIEPPETPWSMTAAIRCARQLDAAMKGVSSGDESWNRTRDRLFDAQNELRQSVLTQHEFSVAADNLSDGLQVVSLTLQGEALSPDATMQRLDNEIADRMRILDEQEQEALERYLLGEVAEGLRVRLRDAARLVETMTAEVSRRPMSTGMQMRFKWTRADDGPPGLAEACEVLSTASATWSPEERRQIKQFLQASIRVQRESEQTESWSDHLATALDYRAWHRIAIERRSGPDAAWKRLTRRTYGSGSGGEKAIALTLPQLAAAAAYYQSADKHAPRFILLDEAFAGVSSDGREGCMELIEAFQLDAVMTSESEWGMYPGVRRLAICQLDRFPEFNAVVNRVFLWNGRERKQALSGEEAAEAAAQPLFSNHNGQVSPDD